MSQNLKANDEVMVIAGSHKGETATIVKIDRKTKKAMLEGIGLVERHLKKSYLNPAGGKKTVHLGVDLSNLKLVKAAEYQKADKKEAKTGKATTKKAQKGAK